MNHKEKQQKIWEEFNKLKTNEKEREVTYDDGVNLKVEYNPKYRKIKEKAKVHKEEVMKGCGGEFYVVGYSSEFTCGKGLDIYDDNSKEINLCPLCQAIIDKYSEAGI